MMLSRIGIAAALVASAFVLHVRAETPARISDAEFDTLHTLIRRQSGESRWMEIDWYPNVWEARRKAAAEGKPLFLMAGSGGAPSAGC